MRQTDEKEIGFNIRFTLGQMGNSWYQVLAGRDHARREAAAKFIAETIIAKFREPIFFGIDSMPVEQADIEGMIGAALIELGPLTYNAARTGHQATRRGAIAVMAERIMQRLETIEILVADPIKAHGELVKKLSV